MERSLKVILLVMFVLTAYSGSTFANYAISKDEMKLLPPYCKARFEMSEQPQIAERWKSILGPDFINVHHYCQGLNFIKRAYSSFDANSRRYNLQNAINNFNYMFNHLINKKFVLLPEIYLNLGKAYLLDGNSKNAILNFSRSIATKKNYTPAYAAMSDLYRNMGNKKQALIYIEKGLAISPRSRILRRRLNDIKNAK